jgi:TonB family protein
MPSSSIRYADLVLAVILPCMGCGGAAQSSSSPTAPVASPGASSDGDIDAPPAPPGVGDSLAVLDDHRPRGELSHASIEAGIGAGRPAISACIARAAQDGPVDDGRVVVTFIIEPTGAVESVAFLVSTLTDETLAGCVLDALRSIRFEPPRGGIVVVSYPFSFRFAGG